MVFLSGLCLAFHSGYFSAALYILFNIVGANLVVSVFTIIVGIQPFGSDWVRYVNVQPSSDLLTQYPVRIDCALTKSFFFWHIFMRNTVIENNPLSFFIICFPRT